MLQRRTSIRDRTITAKRFRISYKKCPIQQRQTHLGIVAKEIKFYPEDEAIMAKMKTAREQIEYANKLIDEGKFIR